MGVGTTAREFRSQAREEQGRSAGRAAAPAEKGWEALTSPEAIKRYMFGSTVVSDWKEGSGIVWRGEWKGRPFEDRGAILKLEPGRLLRYSHYSPLSGLPDEPGNRHTITVELSAEGEGTAVALAQDNNATEEERAHSEANWSAMLVAQKGLVEDGR